MRALFAKAYNDSEVEFTSEHSPEHIGDAICNHGRIDQSIHDVALPVNDFTGWRGSDLNQLFSTRLSSDEKASILANIPRVRGSYAPEKLSDAQILQSIPPKYCDDITSITSWREVISEAINADSPSDSVSQDTAQVSDASASVSVNNV